MPAANQAEIIIQQQKENAYGKDSALMAKLQSTYKLLRSRSFNRDRESRPQIEVRRRDRSLNSREDQQGSRQQEDSGVDPVKDPTLIYSSEEKVERSVGGRQRVRGRSPQQFQQSNSFDGHTSNGGQFQSGQTPGHETQQNQQQPQIMCDNRQNKSERSQQGPPANQSNGNQSQLSNEFQSNQQPSCPTTRENPAFRGSPSLKRMTGVTDLDKAMKDRDQEFLSKRFGETGMKNSPHSASVNSNHSCSDDQETDIDDMSKDKVHAKFRNRNTSGENSPLSKSSPSSPMFPPPASSPLAFCDEKRQLSDPRGKEILRRRPNNLEDAVSWPLSIPGTVDFTKFEVFEGMKKKCPVKNCFVYLIKYDRNQLIFQMSFLGQMLLNWLQSTIDDKHYLRLVMTRHDMSVVLTQFCTCLIAAGIMKEKEGRNEQMFKVNIFIFQCSGKGNNFCAVIL